MSTRVSGTFQTPYGRVRFYMDEANKAHLFTDDVFTTLRGRIEYKGQMSVYYDDKESEWKEKHGCTGIDRADGKDIDHKKNDYSIVKAGLIEGWREYIKKPENSMVVKMAKLVELDNLAKNYHNAVQATKEQFIAARDARQKFLEENGPIKDALKQEIEEKVGIGYSALIVNGV